MNAAIYSAGASIKNLAASTRLTAHARAYPLRIGVNSAICFLPDKWLTWYAAGDARCYHPNYTGHKPASGWCCASESARAEILQADPAWGAVPSMTWPDLRDLMQIHQTYSITAAIALAAHLGARAITVHAHDAEIGHGSACGRFSDRYPPDRHAVESDHINTLRRHLHGRGIPVYFAPKETP